MLHMQNLSIFSTLTVIGVAIAFQPTQAPKIEARADTPPDGCYSLSGLLAACTLEHDEFNKWPASSKAECLCYMSGPSGDAEDATWVPDLFDGYANKCAKFASTADKEDYKTWSSDVGICRSVKNILSAGNTVKGDALATYAGGDSPTTTAESSGSETTHETQREASHTTQAIASATATSKGDDQNSGVQLSLTPWPTIAALGIALGILS
ncbi:hypothetical protein FSARC_13318 [Fusarium sarcochroum]|uniref:Extracellular membrane protein CFEM domain-containing protein n=1 Tax=Fusarium sarcochroum TaxID=1208366 RepID=A0A8H4WU85_9HYPO|nr:hypothetical protein FSARC_13318 [Fusarium sarcochroum]